jgi:hypothetical protein
MRCIVNFFVHTIVIVLPPLPEHRNAQSAFSHFTISSSLPNWLYYPLYDPKFNTDAIVAEHDRLDTAINANFGGCWHRQLHGILWHETRFASAVPSRRTSRTRQIIRTHQPFC